MAAGTRVIAVACQKGGVAKTTTVHNVGASLAKMGKRVLMLDMDPQADLTVGCGVDDEALEKHMYDCLINDTPIQEVILQVSENLHIVPSHIDLAMAEMQIVNKMNKDLKLKRVLAPVLDSYDFVLIDCPPSLGQLTINALHAAQEVLIPMLPEFRPFRAIDKFLDTMELVIEGGANPNLTLTGVVITLFNPSKKLHNQIKVKLQDLVGDKLFSTIVRANVRLAEAPIIGKDIFNFSEKSAGAADYAEVTKELVARGGAV